MGPLGEVSPLLHLPQVSSAQAALSTPFLAFPLATHTERGTPMPARPPARSMALPPRPGSAGRTHTQGSWRSTYSPFLPGRRARLGQSSVLLFHLREQTQKSPAGQGRGTQHSKPRGRASHRPLSLKGRAPERPGILGPRTWTTDTLGSTLSGDNFKNGESLWEPRPTTRALPEHPVARGGCAERSTVEVASWPWFQGGERDPANSPRAKRHTSVQLRQGVV